MEFIVQVAHQNVKHWRNKEELNGPMWHLQVSLVKGTSFYFLVSIDTISMTSSFLSRIICTIFYLTVQKAYIILSIYLLRRVDPNSQYILGTIFYADNKRLIITKSENKIKFGGHWPFKEVRSHFSKWPQKELKRWK